MNYVGSLQELCQARAWDFPKYEYSQGIKGLSKNQKHYYTVKCTAGPYTSEGVGKTKKMAKKQAAKKLLKHWVTTL
ncbi:interferon-inducible double-stranded RNA-dependent protein kinase activator A [Aphis craccivora]|uniref:Interferon-inducible double-stranded RNA-dependent protein kinase activator A n=1 Tax=Aphis craccivora TaxID=307492 RepID=A0A6G0YU89_APHCR|nr:interferon-inducible double-stranded RNA-dependent protein kinase activator A [Aphis craccivora]